MIKNSNNKSSLRQQEIIDSARRIIGTKGIENLTIREIANELRLTDGALYRHFKSKKEIISLLIDDVEKALLEAVNATSKSAGGPLSKLENILSLHLSSVEQKKGFSFIVINEALNLQDKKLQRKMFHVIHKYLRNIKDIIIQGVKSGELRKGIDPTSASIAFFGMVQSLVTLWALSGFRYSINKKHLEQIFNFYREGVM